MVSPLGSVCLDIKVVGLGLEVCHFEIRLELFQLPEVPLESRFLFHHLHFLLCSVLAEQRSLSITLKNEGSILLSLGLTESVKQRLWVFRCR